MTYGQLLQTRTDAVVTNRTYYACDEPNGRVVGRIVGGGQVLGKFLEETQTGVRLFGATRWFHLQLTHPVTWSGKTYTSVWMKADDLVASGAAPVKVWANTAGAVVYAKPATTAATVTRVAAGALIGTADGTYNGSFLYVKLAGPAVRYGYVLRSALTTQDPAAPATATEADSPGLPGESTSWLERTLGKKAAVVVAWTWGVILVLLVGFVGWKLTRKS